MKSRFLSALLGLLTVIGLRADQVEMQNGDRYVGSVLSMNSSTLMLRSETLGTLKLPRTRIANITLGASVSAATNAARSPVAAAASNQPVSLPAQTNVMTDLSAAIRQLGSHSNLLQQVQSEYLATAGPEANQKFTEMMTGLMTGRITANDLRGEAQSTVDQIRELKKDLGDDVGGSLDVYLSILESFLKETAPAPTTAPASAPKADFSISSPTTKSKASLKDE